MNKITLPSLLGLIALTGCGGGGGGGAALPPGPAPATGLTLAQLSAGEFSSSRNSGGINKSIRYREPDSAAVDPAEGEATLARILADGRKLQGILFSDNTENGEIGAAVADVATTANATLIDDVYVQMAFADGTLELKALDFNPAGGFQSVLGGMWRLVPTVTGNTRAQTFTGGWHAGSLTDVADLPTGTNVIFSGNVLGVYVRNDNVAGGPDIPLVISEVTGNASVELNFVSGQIVEGANSALFNLTLVDLPGQSLNEFEIVNGIATAIAGNTWDAELRAVNQTNDGTDFSAASESDISGRFYGPNASEMGSAFRVRDDSEREILSGMFLATRP